MKTITAAAPKLHINKQTLNLVCGWIIEKGKEAGGELQEREREIKKRRRKHKNNNSNNKNK